MAQWSLRVHRELSRWKRMGDEYTPSSEEMKHLKMPSRRDMDFLHSYNNEGYMHSNVIDLEKYIRRMEEIGNGNGSIRQSTDDEFQFADEEDHDPFECNIINDEEEPISLITEKEWELVRGDEIYGWEMV
jgi:hypothetical protein